jgi:hypothetical protein
MSTPGREVCTIVVLGMHRSGTSVLARALISLGVDFGSSLMSGKQDNPKGHFEDQEVYALNEAFLSDMGCRWHSLVLPDDYPTDLASAYLDRAEQLLSEKFDGIPLWGLKEPRITRLLPLWEAAIAGLSVRCNFILANRNPFSVADSLARRNEMPRAQALALWALHQLDGLRAITRQGGLIVDYDLLLTRTRDELERLGAFLCCGLEQHETGIASFMGDFLEQGLRHSHYEEQPDASPGLESLCLSFHQNLLELAGTSGPLRADELARAKEILQQTEEHLAAYKHWFSALDTLYARMESQAAEQREQIQEKDLVIAKLSSQLAWLEGRGPVRFVRRLKDMLP